MAIARCKSHGPPEGRTRTYNADPCQPIGYPRTAVVCGIQECEEPALVWLDTTEHAAYTGGQRIFRIPSFAAKLRVE